MIYFNQRAILWSVAEIVFVMVFIAWAFQTDNIRNAKGIALMAIPRHFNTV
jgi:hypothetical protein